MRGDLRDRLGVIKPEYAGFSHQRHVLDVLLLEDMESSPLTIKLQLGQLMIDSIAWAQLEAAGLELWTRWVHTASMSMSIWIRWGIQFGKQSPTSIFHTPV
jgi:hypothetical protein